MIPLNQIKVASPCQASWQEMEGTEQVRFCQGCQKSVYNLSEMSQDAAQRLVMEHEGRLCVRFYARRDGTMLTQDCPVGLRAVRKKLAYGLSAAAAVLLACLTSPLRAKSQPGMGFSAQVVARKAQLHQMQPLKMLLDEGAPPAMTMGGMQPPPLTQGQVAAMPPPPHHVVLGKFAPRPLPKLHTSKKSHRPASKPPSPR